VLIRADDLPKQQPGDLHLREVAVRRVIRPLAVMLLAVVALSACQDGAGDEP